MALGGAFVTIKLVEYARAIGGGIGLETSVSVFPPDRLHLLHVCLGIIILAIVCRRADPVHVETGTVFWHKVSLAA